MLKFKGALNFCHFQLGRFGSMKSGEDFARTFIAVLVCTIEYQLVGTVIGRIIFSTLLTAIEEKGGANTSIQPQEQELAIFELPAGFATSHQFRAS